jgi:hypothetical protein
VRKPGLVVLQSLSPMVVRLGVLLEGLGVAGLVQGCFLAGACCRATVVHVVASAPWHGRVLRMRRCVVAWSGCRGGGPGLMCCGGGDWLVSQEVETQRLWLEVPLPLLREVVWWAAMWRLCTACDAPAS